MPLHLRPSDLRALAALAADATVGTADIAEGVHAAIWRTLGVRERRPGRTRGITGGVYRAVRAITRLVGRALGAVLGRVPDRASGDGARQRQAVLAALNGVLGDRLVATGNALATSFSLRGWVAPLAGRTGPSRGRPVGSLRGEGASGAQQIEGAATGRIVLMVHGLCMNDLQWEAEHEGTPVDHGATLGRLGWTPVYARYNSGLHISQNGRTFAAQIEALVASWPVPVEEIAVVAHSMGGLVTRSAVHAARGQNFAWPDLLSRIVFLGTPHHGAPLERAGNGVDWLLAQSRTTRPLAALGQIRSAGVTDLRHGNALDVDWQGADRFERRGDTRQRLPLPAGVACYAVAAAIPERQRPGVPLADRVLGDGLVPVPSALGQHADPSRTLSFTDSVTLDGLHHFDLLSDPRVTARLLDWFGPDAV